MPGDGRPEEKIDNPQPEEPTIMFVQLAKTFMGRQPGERIDVSEADGNALIQSGTAAAIPADDAINQLVAKLTGTVAESMTKSLDAVINATLTKFQNAQSQA